MEGKSADKPRRELKVEGTGVKAQSAKPQAAGCARNHQQGVRLATKEEEEGAEKTGSPYMLPTVKSRGSVVSLRMAGAQDYVRHSKRQKSRQCPIVLESQSSLILGEQV